jgi:hypothetical protein
VELDELLTRFAWTLAKPLERDDNALDYIPSQRLSEFARDVGFNGIRYPSAMRRGGTNTVFFDPAGCEIGESTLVKVTNVDIGFSENIALLTEDYPDQ